MCGWPESERRNVWEHLETYRGGLMDALRGKIEREKKERKQKKEEW